MPAPPPNFVLVSEGVYARFARALGMSPLGTQLLVGGQPVGWRTNKRVYIESSALALFRKRFPLKGR